MPRRTLCAKIPAGAASLHYLQEGVGHYGVFNGSRFRQDIAPRIRDFFSAMETDSGGRR